MSELGASTQDNRGSLWVHGWGYELDSERIDEFYERLPNLPANDRADLYAWYASTYWDRLRGSNGGLATVPSGADQLMLDLV